MFTFPCLLFFFFSWCVVFVARNKTENRPIKSKERKKRKKKGEKEQQKKNCVAKLMTKRKTWSFFFFLSSLSSKATSFSFFFFRCCLCASATALHAAFPFPFFFCRTPSSPSSFSVSLRDCSAHNTLKTTNDTVLSLFVLAAFLIVLLTTPLSPLTFLLHPLYLHLEVRV